MSIQIEVPWLKKVMDLFVYDWQAITIYHLIFTAGPLSDELLRHEEVHVKQWDKWLLLFPILYAAASVEAVLDGGHWYWWNRFERQARVVTESNTLT